MALYKETIVISMGGSLLVPDTIDTDFIKQLREMVSYAINEGYQVVLILGGGKTCRRYQAAAQEFDHVTDEDLDWIGIKTIHLNCELLLHIFSDYNVHPKVILDPHDIKEVMNSLIIVGAERPGRSSDADAVDIAQVLGAQRVINFSNTSHVYSADPKTHPDAKAFDQISWKEYRELIPREWTPGLSSPFDPVASREAEEYGMTVVVLGASIENLRKYLGGGSFEGTVIS